MKVIVCIIIILIAGYFLYNNFLKYPYRYIGYFYPDIDSLDKWVESEPLSNIDECREWIDDMANSYGTANSGNFDYECGKDCYKGDPYNQGVTYTCNSSER